jgi:hypothetical protein
MLKNFLRSSERKLRNQPWSYEKYSLSRSINRNPKTEGYRSYLFYQKMCLPWLKQDKGKGDVHKVALTEVWGQEKTHGWCQKRIKRIITENMPSKYLTFWEPIIDEESLRRQPILKGKIKISYLRCFSSYITILIFKKTTV